MATTTTEDIVQPGPKTLARLALPILKDLKARDAAWEEDRAESRRQATRDRSFDWQSYCRHGTYVGDPYGGDYMCGACEDGASVYEEAITMAYSAYYRWQAAMPHLHALRELGVITSDEGFDLSMRVAPK